MIKSSHYRSILFSFLIGNIHAGTLTIQPKEWIPERRMEAKLMPETAQVFIWNNQAWQDFPVLSALPNGSLVKKDQQLIEINTEQLSQTIKSHSQTLSELEVNLSLKQLEFEKLKEQQYAAQQKDDLSLARLRADWEHFQKIEYPLEISSADRRLEHAQRKLKSHQEELKQLEAMYLDDQLTEATEEFILERQKNEVADSQKDLDAATKQHRWIKEIQLPRKLDDWKTQVKQVETDHKFNIQSRKLNELQSKLALDAAETNLTKAKAHHKKLQSDLSLSQAKADKDGIFLWGSIDNWHWDLSDIPKRLVPGGQIAPKQVLYSIAPINFKPVLVCECPTNTTSLIPSTGSASPSNLPHLKFPVKIQQLNHIATHGPLSQVILEFTSLPEPILTNIGSTWITHLAAPSIPNQIVIPTNSISFRHNGAFVTIKHGDSNSPRQIEISEVQADLALVKSGLQPGEVILTP